MSCDVLTEGFHCIHEMSDFKRTYLDDYLEFEGLPQLDSEYFMPYLSIPGPKTRLRGFRTKLYQKCVFFLLNALFRTRARDGLCTLVNRPAIS